MNNFTTIKQEKAFYIPIFDEVKRNVWRSNNIFETLKKGDLIINKTLYYKLPKNFLILQEEHDLDNVKLHIIEDSKIIDTVSINNLDDSFFIENYIVFDKNGISIKIKSKSDCINYVKEYYVELYKLKKVRLKVSDVINNELSPLFTIQENLLNEYLPNKNINSKLKIKNIENILNKYTDLKNEIFTLLEIKSITELQSLLSEDSTSYKKTENTILSYINERTDNLIISIKTLNDENNLDLEEVIKNHNDKWVNASEYEQESFLGELLECFIQAYLNKDDELDDFFGDPLEKYINLKTTIKELINEDLNLIESYCKWQEFNQNDEVFIKDLFDFILKSNNEDNYEKLNRAKFL